jgi:hypothetical protein
VLARLVAVGEQQRQARGGRCQCRLGALGLLRLREGASRHAQVTVLLGVGAGRQPQILRRRTVREPGRLRRDQPPDGLVRLIASARQALGKPGRSPVVGALDSVQRAHRGRRQDRVMRGQGLHQPAVLPGQRQQGLQGGSVEPLGARHDEAEAGLLLGHRLRRDRLPERLPVLVDQHDDDRKRVPEPVGEVVII